MTYPLIGNYGITDDDFESKLKEIVEINDSWEVKGFYGQTTYYTFLNNTYCVSIYESKNNKARNSYVFSKKGEMLYRCFTDKDILKLIKEEVSKSRKKC